MLKKHLLLSMLKTVLLQNIKNRNTCSCFFNISCIVCVLLPKMAAGVTQRCSKFFPRFCSSVFKAQLFLSAYLAWTWMFTATYCMGRMHSI